MMTIRESLEAQLTKRGMFPAQARSVMESLITDPVVDSMRGRWGEEVSGYPESLMLALWFTARQKAREWIDANVPNAWYRPLFADDAQGGPHA